MSARASLKLRSKVAVLGDPGVGKSALTQMFQSNGQKFPKNYLMTIGVDFCMKQVQVPETEAAVELYLFDTAGQDLFSEMAPHYWENTDSVVLVYDVTRAESLEHCAEWLERFGRVVPLKSLVAGVLVANKMDLNERAEVSRAQGEDFARRHGFVFLECSALEHSEVDAPFAHLATATHGHYKQALEKFAAAD
mmetsp:Transcript_13368/g.39381  ORF Transcript_13368/g.39381 Transcript_13368/m.39381 type:complete len:193 (+) Transcript_13368:39-617(+)